MSNFRNKKLLFGGIIGGVIGMAAALLLAPKAGKDLMREIVHPFLRSFSTTNQKRYKKGKNRIHKKGTLAHQTLAAHKRVKSRSVKKRNNTHRLKKTPLKHSSVKHASIHKLIDAAERIASS